MLRFGIELMQPEILMEQVSGLSADLPASAELDFSLDVAAAAGRVADLGFQLIELNPDLLVFFPQCLGMPSVQRLRALGALRGLSYTVHLPLWGVDPSVPVRSVNQGAVDALVDGVLRMAPLEPEVYVLHATGALAAEFGRAPYLRSVRPLVMRLLQARARDSIEQLLNRTGLESRRLAVENVEFPLSLTLELAEELGLSVCLDTGHVLAGYSGDVLLADALRDTLPRLAEVHLHDGYFHGRPDGPARIADHLPLGDGDLAVESFLSELNEAGFHGPVILEMTVSEAHASMEVIRARCPDVLADGTGGR